MNRPRLGRRRWPPEFLTPDRLGYPLFACRSRMSDGATVSSRSRTRARAVEAFVAARGGAAFFDRPDWRRGARPRARARARADSKSDDDQRRAIERELVATRETLERAARRSSPARLPALGRDGRGHARDARAARCPSPRSPIGWPGRLAVAAGDDPFFLKRLHSRHVFALPGRGRRVFTTLA